jgi:type I restriction enzyme S subunit
MRAETLTETLTLTDEEMPLPEGWRWVRVGELCNLVNGDAYKPIDWSTSGVPIIRIQNLNDASKPFNYWSGSLHNKVTIKQDDVLLAWSGTPGTSFGVHLWKGSDGVLNQHIFRVDFTSNKIVPEWFVYAANQRLNILISQAHGGVGLRHVNKREVEALKIPFPPTIKEQRRIASILDEQMKAVEEARRAAEEQLEAAKLLPNALSRLIFESEEAQNWRNRKLGEVCRDISDGTHFTPEYVSSGVPFLSVKDVKENGIFFDNCRYITQEQHEDLCRRCKPERGDILYTKVGTTGIAKAIDIDKEFSIFVSVALLKLRDDIDPNYIEKTLNSPIGKEQAENLTQGMANRNLVIRDIKTIEIPIPSTIEEQRKIAERLNEQLQAVETLKKSLTEKLEAIKKLPASLLRKAFAGEI